MPDERLIELEQLQACISQMQQRANEITRAIIADADRKSAESTNEMISVGEAAILAKKDKETIRRWRKKDDVGVMIGGEWLVPLTWVEVRKRGK